MISLVLRIWQQFERWEHRREMEWLRQAFPDSDVIDVDGED